MAQVTIYLPDDLRDNAKAAGLNISKLAQAAIRTALGFPPESTEKERRAAEQVARVDTECNEFRHVGPFKRFSWGTQCQGCKQAVR